MVRSFFRKIRQGFRKNADLCQEYFVILWARKTISGMKKWREKYKKNYCEKKYKNIARKNTKEIKIIARKNTKEMKITATKNTKEMKITATKNTKEIKIL